MTVHHLMTEATAMRFCPNCKREVPAKFESKFDTSNRHYKEFDCECGYTVSVRVGFIGSGDDDWNDNLDKRIEEVGSK